MSSQSSVSLCPMMKRTPSPSTVGVWMSAKKRGRDDSAIEEASKAARRRRREALASAASKSGRGERAGGRGEGKNCRCDNNSTRRRNCIRMVGNNTDKTRSLSKMSRMPSDCSSSSSSAAASKGHPYHYNHQYRSHNPRRHRHGGSNMLNDPSATKLKLHSKSTTLHRSSSSFNKQKSLYCYRDSSENPDNDAQDILSDLGDWVGGRNANSSTARSKSSFVVARPTADQPQKLEDTVPSKSSLQAKQKRQTTRGSTSLIVSPQKAIAPDKLRRNLHRTEAKYSSLVDQPSNHLYRYRQDDRSATACRTKKNRNNIGRDDMKTIQMFSVQLRRHRSEDQRNIKQKRTKVRPRVLIFRKYSTSAKHVIETQRRRASESVDRPDSHRESVDNDSYNIDRNDSTPEVVRDMNDHDDDDVSRNDMTAPNHGSDTDECSRKFADDILETQEPCSPSKEMKLVRSKDSEQVVSKDDLILPLDDATTPPKLSQSKLEDFSGDEEWPGTQDLEDPMSEQASVTTHDVNSLLKSNLLSTMAKNDRSETDNSVLAKDDDEAIGTVKESFLSLPTCNASYSDNESDEVEMTCASAVASQSLLERPEILRGQPSFDDKILSQNITNWMGHNRRYRDCNDGDDNDNDVDAATSAAVANVERYGCNQQDSKKRHHDYDCQLDLEPLTNLRYWEKIVQDEQETTEWSKIEKGSVTSAKFRCAIARLIVAKNRKIQRQKEDDDCKTTKARRRGNEHSFLWLPSLLDGGLSGVY